MAGVITLLENDDGTTREGVHFIRRKFNYTRDAGDDDIVIVNPTTDLSTTGDDLGKGIFDAPWAGIACLSAQNNSGGARQPILPPTLYTTLLKNSDDTITIADGQIIDVLTGEDREWPVSFPAAADNETLRTFPIGSQAAGGRTYWMCFASPNGLSADWILSMQVMEAA